jgi:ribonuclease HI
VGVYWPDRPQNNISEPMSGRATNQRAEIEAARRGIEQAKSQGYREVTVRTDSQYVKNAAESWIPNWEREGWSRDIVNKSEFQGLQRSMDGITVNFEKVPSSANAADPLARSGTANQ